MFNSLQDLLDRTRHLDFLGPVALRLYLFPIFLIAGMKKIDLSTGAPYAGVVQWFDSMGMPAPELMAYLAGYTELLGAFALLLGFALRWACIPLMITMAVAAYTVHWQNGWPAIAEPSKAYCSQPAPDARETGALLRYVGNCYNVNDRTREAEPRLERAKAILNEHGNYSWLTGRGNLVISNNGIEFAATYFVMLLALFFMGAGRYFSIDFWLHKIFRNRSMQYPHRD